MRISKIKIKNLFGITEYEADGKSVEATGANGVGKTSIIDSIRYALTNKSDREYIVRKGSSEGEILIETDTGLSINRKARTSQADYKSIKQNGKEVGSPETFLKDIFTPLQLNPVEFMEMDKKQQNAIILNMIEYDWSLESIKEWFGEIPAWIDYEQNILSVLNDIQSENGQYYQDRRDIQRDIRNKKAFIEEIAAAIPDGYDVDKWEREDAGTIYREIERITKDNATIEKAKNVIENKDNKVRKFQADKEIEIAAIEREVNAKRERITNDITSLEKQIITYKAELDGLDSDKEQKIKLAEQTYKANVAEFEAQVAEYQQYADREVKDTTELQEKASNIEEMKKHINEYRRMMSLQADVEDLTQKATSLTNKIEKARTLPGEILQKCTIPISGLTVENGIPLINGLPVSNLSEGEKLDLCIDVAIQKPNGLQIILIDGAEKLSTELREKLYQKCKDKGLQFIATRTTDDPDITVVEM